MRTSRSLVASLAAAAIVSGAALGGAGIAAAAPARSHAAQVQYTKLIRTNAKITRLVSRVKSCPSASSQLAVAGKARAAAMKGSKTASAARLRRANRTMGVWVVRLARTAGSCGVATPGSSAVVFVGSGGSGGGYTVTPGPLGPGGSGGAGGSAFGSFDLSLPVRPLLDGLPIDVSGLLNGGVLPQVITLVPVSQLTSPLCTTVGTSCVGVDVVALKTVLTGLVAGVPLVGPLVAQITAKLDAGDLASVFTVTRVSDTVVKVVPCGPLATLRALLGSLATAPTTTVGHLTWIG